MSNKYWNPTEDFCIRFADKTAEPRTDEQLAEMVARIKEVAKEYDFGVSAYGGWPGMQKIACGELEIGERYREQVEWSQEHATELGDPPSPPPGRIMCEGEQPPEPEK